MTTLTPEAVVKLLELEAKATPGDWRNHLFILAIRSRIRPLAEAYQRQPDAIKAAQVEALKGMREPLIDVLTHLVAAHSLLSRSSKKAAPSDKMFDQMLADYERSIERGRSAIAELDRRILALEKQP